MRVKLEVCCFQFYDVCRDLEESCKSNKQGLMEESLMRATAQIKDQKIIKSSRLGFFSCLHFRVEEKEGNGKARDWWSLEEMKKSTADEQAQLRKVLEKRVESCRKEETSLQHVARALEQLIEVMRMTKQAMEEVEKKRPFRLTDSASRVLKEQIETLEDILKQYREELHNLQPEIDKHEKAIPYTATTLP